MIYTVYILYSSRIDRYYVGSTQDIKNRLNRHRQGRSKATKAGALDWELVYMEEFQTNAEARQRESYIKRMKSRKFIEDLISRKGD